MNFEIVPITEAHVNDFWSAVDSVAREHKYLSFLEGPPINTTQDFFLQNINGNWPHFVAIQNGKIIGWCDIGICQQRCRLNFKKIYFTTSSILTHRVRGLSTAIARAVQALVLKQFYVNIQHAC